jgi:hypothetical protein
MVQDFAIGDLLTLSLYEHMKVVSVTARTRDSVRSAPPRQRRHWPWGRILLGLLGVALGALGAKAYLFLRDELPSSALQARYLSRARQPNLLCRGAWSQPADPLS